MKESHTIPKTVSTPEDLEIVAAVPAGPEQMFREKYTPGNKAAGLTATERKGLAEAVQKGVAAPAPMAEGTPIALWQVVAGTAGLVALLSVFVWLVWSTAHQWIAIGAVQKFDAREPARVTFDYATASQAGRLTGVAYVVAPQGKAVQAIAGECRYDGTMVEWKPGLRIFVCPTDGAVFAEDGKYQFGGRMGRSLRRMPTRMEGDRVWLFAPRQRPIPLRDQPSSDMPGYM